MTRKNILLVSFDDAVAPWRYKTAFGAPLQIPNLDGLCEVSSNFHAACSQAPVCGPSRASMMTTLMPHETQIFDNARYVFRQVPARRCFVHDLKGAGYFCSAGGKVHHDPVLRPRHHRALYSDESKEFTLDVKLTREMKKRVKFYGGYRHGRGTEDITDDDFFFDAQSASSAISFLENYEGEAPFYRELGFFSPHSPHNTPARFKEMYDHTALHKPPEWSGYIADAPYVVENIPELVEFRDEEYWQKSIRNYFSAYSHADYQLGRVLTALRNSRHADNTVILVVADHGFHLGNRNIFRKTTLWEQSLNVPIIICDPTDGVRRDIHDPVALIDLGPTVLDLAGVAPQERRFGQSLMRLLRGERVPDEIIPSFYKDNVSIRKGRYRLIRYRDGGHQLFDVEEDYWAQHDLGISHPIFAPMKEAMEDWLAAAGYHFESATAPAEAPEDA
ncbi:sulfatase-like hydrolase/transferase [Pseudomonas sp. GX19020]|uniref:sulfatase-like hydrolase/transferase n=1 Tax=Pseudomonas sp. GX19020 TaxID=2942277 RepID=UPI0020199925|nr:sulfatase-like hydrolase/transferase [Pseudomonas sp. GX19020]MCL4069374.1 sulfatase-like hydrolase/transferase [Pseudomonas sp. GX19020]